MTTLWHERWQENRTPWDLHRPHPITPSLLQRINQIAPHSTHGNWLIPGCGRAHDCAALVAAGASKILCVDIVPQAIVEAQKLYGNLPQVELMCANIFDLDSAKDLAFDGIFDRAMLCALQDQERTRYARTVTKLTRKGGFFASIPFQEVYTPKCGPPFQISERELHAEFSENWDILVLDSVRSIACDQKILSEWMFIARKK